MTYKSKKDWWLYGLARGAVLGLLSVRLFNLLAPFGAPHSAGLESAPGLELRGGRPVRNV